MNKSSVDDTACDRTTRLEEQVDEKFREALKRLREIYGMGAADGLAGVARKASAAIANSFTSAKIQ